MYLAHHGIKGMHWGVRRYQDENGQLTAAGKRRYSIQDARKYYKINRLQRAREETQDADKKQRLDARIRRVETRSDRKHSDLSQEELNIGRQLVSRNRKRMHISATAISSVATAAGAAALYANPNTRWAAPLVAGGGAVLTAKMAKKIPYYTMEARRYNQVNPKGALKKGTTFKQRALRNTAKAAGATAAVLGTAALVGLAANQVDKYRDYNNAYKNASPEERARMDAQRQYDQGVKIRKGIQNGVDIASNIGRKVYNVATSDITKDAIKSGAQKVKHIFANRQTKKAGRAVARVGMDTARGIGNITRGVVGIGGRPQTVYTSGNNRSTARSNDASETFRKRSSAKISRAAKNAAKRAVFGKNFDPDDPTTWAKAGTKVYRTAQRSKQAKNAVKSMRG